MARLLLLLALVSAQTPQPPEVEAKRAATDPPRAGDVHEML